jgi:predicted phage tail protein
MAIVHLHGHLGDKYGYRFELAVHSVAEAVRLLAANFRSFNADLLQHRPGFLIRVNGQSAFDVAGLREMHLNPDIHIVPAILGAGGDNDGLGRVALAAVVAVASYYLGPAGAGLISSSTQSGLYAVAVNLAISGVSAMLFSNKQNPTDEMTGEKNLASYAFNGPVNTTAQGNPVPVLYGHLRVGSQVVSAGISSE